MAILEHLLPHLNRLHEELERGIHGLTPEQIHWRPGDGCNNIAFAIWHYTRTEDNLTRFVLQDRRPTSWLEGGWDEKFGLDRVIQGTGMDAADAAALRLPSVEEFLPYMQTVWAATDQYINSISDADLARIVTVRPLGDRSVGDLLTENILTHGFSHAGEIWVLRGLQGFQGASF